MAGGETVELDLPMRTRWERFPDQPGVAALVYGSVVLAQQMQLGTITAALIAEHWLKIDAAPPPVSAAILPRPVAASAGNDSVVSCYCRR